MSETAIRIQNVRKEFLLSHAGAASIKSMLMWWKKRRLEHFVALHDVSFEVQKGESVALIGKNGAGKSTILSLIAKIYRPNAGSVQVQGRIAPLLELGAGFHPDLTGLENVLFNGMILGLTRKQVQERLPQIVEFAELGGHIDSPVRTYSSGMMARLGFSIAVHVDADILLVDEVLAVGDHDFEQKCYAKIAEFREGGGTIFFVSHNPAAVEKVADRCIWMQKGEVHMDGPVHEILRAYQPDYAG